ncbi:Equilibrative nucleoside transporter 3 [Araneus ventricosus]|uniref:Equilibrative nucleoside transporter 3 n=1 Tax=Araneus ventricosus TaxID=182803 RepID=A0A4Y2IYH7_ARAVE|nr:Equilibrative nucleoside transporter 3 [Araneus ventricosus]
MPLRTPYYSDYNPTNDDHSSDQQYLMSSGARGRNGHTDPSYYSGDTIPLRHISSNTSGTGDISITPAKKRIGTLDVINPMEQETLLDPGPVKLAPCWESRHAPTDELNFKTTTPKGEFDGKPPTDRGGTLTFRIIGSIIIEIIIFIVTVFLAMVDSSSWPGIFFYVTMASVVIINMANGIYQNSIYGLAAKLPMKYSMAIVLGANTSGTFTSLILILSIAASPNLRTAAIYYFITALFVLLACVDTYFALPLIRYYRYYDRLTQKAITENRANTGRPPYCKIFWKTWTQCFNVFFVFFVTLTVFPAIHADIQMVDKDFIIPEKYFTPVTCYLCFNFFAMMGSLVPNWIKWPGPRFLWIPVVLRILMIPYFMLCNYKPDKRQIPILIDNDWAYFGMAVAFGFTSGYYSSLAMMYAPGCVETEHAPIAGMMAALFLVLGIVCGVNFTFFTNENLHAAHPHQGRFFINVGAGIHLKIDIHEESAPVHLGHIAPYRSNFQAIHLGGPFMEASCKPHNWSLQFPRYCAYPS